VLSRRRDDREREQKEAEEKERWRNMSEEERQRWLRLHPKGNAAATKKKWRFLQVRPPGPGSLAAWRLGWAGQHWQRSAPVHTSAPRQDRRPATVEATTATGLASLQCRELP
jgi:hypothetical protein